MKELETIKAKISELENKKETLSTEIAELSQAINDSFEDLIQGKVDEKTLDKAKEKYKSLTTELEKTEEYIQRAIAVRKKLASEKFIPFAKERREKKIKEGQERYEKQADVVRQSIKNLLQEQAKLGQIRNETVSKANNEFNDVMIALGENPDIYGLPIHEVTVISNGYTADKDAIGVNEKIQKSTYSSGKVPHWAAGDSE